MSFPPEHFINKRVTVMGLGHFGGQISVVRFLVSQGAQVTVTDIAPPEKLTAALEQIKDLDVHLHLGGHIEADFVGVDLIVVSPAVPKDSRYLKLAELKGISITCEMNLFLDRCRANVLAVTGTAGKSTTVAMIEAILTHARDTDVKAGFRDFWVGGNIGKSLLTNINAIHEDDIVVLELSSFQLEDLAGLEYSPHISLVTNIFPNHLDRHLSVDNYIQAKSNITRFQTAGDLLITNADNANCRKLEEIAPFDVTRWYFGLENDGATPLKNVSIAGNGDTWTVRSNVQGLAGDIVTADALAVPGRHNVDNAAAAAAAALALGICPETIGSALSAFKGLPDRLETVSDSDGIRWFNDSKSTTPQAGIVALQAFRPGSVIAIVGGYDKGSDLNEFAHELAARTRTTICLGQTGPRLAEAVRMLGKDAIEVFTLEEAVTQAGAIASRGDVVLLSPGCASWDMFSNYQERGNIFRSLAREPHPPVHAH